MRMILDEIVAFKMKQVEEEKKQKPLQEYLGSNRKDVRDFKHSICKADISIIAEIKKASPSKGIICTDFDPIKTAKVYERLKVDAVSILTERQFFQGQDCYIAEAKLVNSKPVLRKDFIIDEYQVFQARAIGADAVLLITAVLGNQIKRFNTLTQELGMKAITEVHNKLELDLALGAGCDIIGINNRDLRSFEVSLKTTEELMRYIPKNIITVSESGIASPSDIRYLKELGVNAVLIGETFMRNLDNERYLEEFISEARRKQNG